MLTIDQSETLQKRPPHGGGPGAARQAGRKNQLETDEAQDKRFERANTLGLAYLRTMILLNGGAILALLTFMGSASAQTFISLAIESIQTSMSLFLVGITSMMVGLLVSYVHEALAVGTRAKHILSHTVIALNAICSAVSLISFVIGVATIINGAQATV